MYGFHGMSWGMGFGWLFGIIFLGLIIWLLVRVTNSQNNSTEHRKESALDLLKKRFARGEIGEEEYERIKNKIS